ncbi:unnamed protein product [Mytilus coruscus]|uniref:Mitochondria-eating protein C-terminal domain-containing protein n=1 Tax=Mytilus coruscus TaxID=42192 RepID=A0A6J8C2C0_MYTCO|nr:unnamed protein product [Mytilus coruscus]
MLLAEFYTLLKLGQKGKENAVLIESIESFLQNAKEQRQCSSTLVDSVQKICCDDYGSLNQTTSEREKEFVRKCSELCWYMISADPPMVIEYEKFENKLMDSNKFNKYNRTGTTVEYVVWPVLLLHKDGPVLAKGSVQTNFEPKNDRIAARKKSTENVLAAPLACRSISSDDHVTIPSQITNNNNTKGESIQVQLKTEKTCTDQSDRTIDVIDSKNKPGVDQSTNVSSVTLRNKNISASGEKLSTDNSKSDFGEKTISKCAEFMKSEENVLQSIDGD